LDEVVFGERGLLAVLGDGAIHLAMSTIEPATARRLADAHGRRGARYVAAPVFGRPEVAGQGKLWVIAAGASDAVETCVLALKDARLVLRAAAELGVPMPLANLAHDHMLTGVARGQGHLDWTAVAEVLRDAAGLGGPPRSAGRPGEIRA